MNKLSEIQQEMLTQRRIAAVATIDEEGMPHLTAVWFLFDGERFYVTVNSSSVKVQNLSGNEKMALMIDSREAGKEIGISASGAAEILQGDEAAEATGAIHTKYLTEEGRADPDVGAVFEEWDDTVIRLTPQRWAAWDVGVTDQEAFGGKLGGLGYAKPLEV